MDLFLINGQENLSLPEMIDWDMKLCDTEMGLNEEVGISNYLGVGYDLSSLDMDEEHNLFGSQSYSANSNSSFELDLLGEGASALMVNPSSVVPFVSSQRRFTSQPKVEPTDDDTSETKVKLEAPVQIKEEVEIKVEEEIEEENIKSELKEEELSEGEDLVTPEEIVTVPVEFINVPMDGNIIEVIPAAPAKKIQPTYKRQVSPLSINVESSPVKAYPKPAYSYSCLIAMALKNSLTGSLPVSEIYSFMCHHFPYFKTAPSGWKNSVRHNLSLNKCFEKIEKPPGTGTSGSQRKGCLWAMNPAKISKMDEEVAKWSKKDPSAIKKAMVNPDNLELLERGELKDLTAFGTDEADEDVEETKEGEEDIEDDFVAEDDRISPIDDDSDDEISKVPPSLRAFEPKFARLAQHKSITKTDRLSKKSLDTTSEVNTAIKSEMYSELDMSDTRVLLGLDESTPVYAVDPMDENLLIELPLVKRPRYIYQPVLNVKRHNIANLRSIKIHSP